MENPEITLSEYWRIIRKRKWTIISVFITVFLSTVIFTKLQTPVYHSAIEIKIEKQQPLLADSTTGALTVQTGAALNLATEIRLIKSLPVLRKVVEKIEVLPPTGEERENAIHSIALQYQKNVQADQIADTNIINIQVFSNDPQTATLMASAIADVYIVENIEGRKKQLKAMIEFIDKQLTAYKKSLADQESDLQKFKQNEKVFEVTPDIKATLDRSTIEGTFEFETEMLKIDSDLKKLKKVLQNKSETNMGQIISEKNLSENYIFVGLKRRLLELEFERFLLLIDYTERHPDVVIKNQIIGNIKEKIVIMLKNFSSIPITLEVETDLALYIKKLFLETRREVLYRIVNRFYGDSGSLSSNQLQYVRLKRNVDRLLNSYDNFLNKRTEARLDLSKVIDDVVTVVSPATKPETPIKPNARVNYLVATAVGILLGILIAFLKESVDTSVSTISDVEQDLKLNILGIVPHMKKEEVLTGKEDLPEGHITKKMILQRARLVTITSPKSWHSESIKMIRTNLMQLNKNKNIKCVLFTSSDKQEGKSTMVTNLALSIAQLGKKIILVGGNMRRPTVYKIFGLNREPGLSDVLMGNTKWKNVVNTSTDILTGGLNVDQLLHMPGIDNLSVLTCGRPVDNVSELLNSKDLDLLLKELRSEFDIIIMDCSPVMAVPDAITLSDKVDGMVLIYKVGHTPKDVLKMAKNNLTHANANILGVVLNDIKTEAQVGYSAYYYRYYSETGSKPQKKPTPPSKSGNKNIFNI
ncbi:MAG: polysaccharide biosynthesis tyrosine autokinase [Candidatus Omnitrophica bacterium]|nr:polysaccharide biosynthesis tyrosine autokinase [Candidatus Omnitrophota bacterium]